MPDTPPQQAFADELSYHPPNHEERISALRLLADSVAQQRQIQNSALLWHPFSLFLFSILTSIIFKMNWESPFGTTLLLTCGGIMAGFSLLGRFTYPWIEIAEEIGCSRGLALLEKKKAVVAVWRGEVIGVIAWSEDEKDGLVLKIWGFTVRRRERGRGVGGDLIRKMVDQAGKNSPDEDIRIEMEENNIYAKRALGPKYNWMLDDIQSSGLEMVREIARRHIEETAKKG